MKLHTQLTFTQRSGMDHFIPKKKFYPRIESISHSHFPLSNSVWKMEYKHTDVRYIHAYFPKFAKLYVPTTKRQVFIASLPHKTSSDLTAIAIYSIQPSLSHIHTPPRESHTSFVKLLCCCWWWCVFNREQLRRASERKNTGRKRDKKASSATSLHLLTVSDRHTLTFCVAEPIPNILCILSECMRFAQVFTPQLRGNRVKLGFGSRGVKTAINHPVVAEEVVVVVCLASSMVVLFSFRKIIKVYYY